jgi:Fur family ferric uptake transcriptional regulator
MLRKELSSNALFGQWLHKQGLRLTPHRMAVLEALRTASPLSAEALHKKVPQAHLVTLYRTLDTFSRAGVVRTIGIDPTRATFELALDHHHHIVCLSCERVEDVRLTDALLERQALKKSRQFRSIQNHSLEFFGLCNTCVCPQ